MRGRGMVRKGKEKVLPTDTGNARQQGSTGSLDGGGAGNVRARRVVRVGLGGLGSAGHGGTRAPAGGHAVE